LPEDTYIDGQLLCTVAGAIIRAKTDGYPKNEFDGTLIANITSDCTVNDNDHDVTDVVYYAAFPYTDQGVYNRSDKNRRMNDGIVAGYIFGYDIDLADPDPYTRVSYPDNDNSTVNNPYEDRVDNAGWDPVYMDFTNDRFEYGSWNIAPGEKFMPRPCMLNEDGTVDQYLDPDNYTKKDDGTPSDVANTSTSYTGNAMMEWPKIYTKRWEENGVYHFRCSDAKIDDSWDCWCNYDKNDNEIPHFYTGIYLAYRIDTYDKLRSLSGDSDDNKYNYNERKYARLIGDDWGIEVLADRLLITDLLVMMSRNTDLQEVYGYQYFASNANYKDCPHSGSMDYKGMFWGDTNNQASDGVKVFGMEHFWIDHGRSVDGWWYDNNTTCQYVKITRGGHDGTSVADYGSDYTGYKQYPAPSKSGYISEMTTTPYGRLPIGGKGSDSTYETDYITLYTLGEPAPLVIGQPISDNIYSDSGPFAAYNDFFGGKTALSCKPSVS
jgi:hypothetical protein